MSRVVLDTDILSEVLADKDANVAAKAQAYREAQGRYTLTVIAVVEIVRGLRRAGANARAEAFIASLGQHEVAHSQHQRDEQSFGRVDRKPDRPDVSVGDCATLPAAGS